MIARAAVAGGVLLGLVAGSYAGLVLAVRMYDLGEEDGREVTRWRVTTA